MLPKTYLTSHYRMSGARWVTTPLWLFGSWRSFLYNFSVYSWNLFLISSASLRSMPFLSFYWAHLCMKCPLGISNFLEEISSLSHSFVSLYFFALITEEGFLISPCYSLKLCIQMDMSFLFSFAFSLLFFSQLFIRPPQTAIFPLSISFSGWFWSPPSVQCYEPPSIVLQALYQI